jgi:hypothetical protein
MRPSRMFRWEVPGVFSKLLLDASLFRRLDRDRLPVGTKPSVKLVRPTRHSSVAAATVNDNELPVVGVG